MQRPHARTRTRRRDFIGWGRWTEERFHRDKFYPTGSTDRHAWAPGGMGAPREILQAPGGDVVVI